MSGGSGGDGCASGHGDVWDVLWTSLFLFMTWAVGQLTVKIGLPPVVRCILLACTQRAARRSGTLQPGRS